MKIFEDQVRLINHSEFQRYLQGMKQAFGGRQNLKCFGHPIWIFRGAAKSCWY